MRYKKGRRFGLAHSRQSLIYFLCANYDQLSLAQRRYIGSLCESCGGEWRQALFLAVTTDRRLIEIAADFGGETPPSESTIYRLCRRFYERFELGAFLGEGGCGLGE